MNLKRVLPIEVNYMLRHIREWGRNEQLELASEVLDAKKRVFFLDAPAYENIGDQAIAYAMERFIKKTLPDYEQIEVTEDKIPSTLQWLKKNIRETDLICLTGGGNMGVMYQRYESVRRLIINTFSHNPIVIFPQTFDYEDSVYGRRELNRAKLVYRRASKLVLSARDEESYEKMKMVFPEARIIFCPDIVLSLDYRGCFQQNAEVGICLRNDAESVVSDEDKQILHARYPKYVALSTMDSKDTVVNYHNRKDVVERKLLEFGSKKLIITDRLHGTIFSYITGTPVIALPNTNGKVERVCRYLSSNGSVVFAKDIDSIPNFEVKTQGTLMGRFEELSDAIKSIVNN